MALAIKHNFVTTKSDGTDATLLRPSNWNEDHDMTLATASLVGRQSAGAGPAEEIPCSAAAATMLAAADIPGILAALGISPPTTGDGKFTFKTTPDAGWLMMDDGTFGNATSGASNRANADTEDLFTLLYSLLDADAPLATSTGAATTRSAQGSATTAFTAGCRLSLPKQLGRAIVGTGGRLGQAFGGTATLSTANLPPYTPSGAVGVTVTANVPIQGTSGGTTIGGVAAAGTNNGGRVDTPIINVVAGAAFAGNPQGGSSTPFSVQTSATAWSVMVKL